MDGEYYTPWRGYQPHVAIKAITARMDDCDKLRGINPELDWLLVEYVADCLCDRHRDERRSANGR